MSKTFLRAEWRKLAIANYIVDPAIFQKYLPRHTQIDLWQGQCYVSLVGFLFTDVKVMGFKIPFHSTFEEVNLRFYVKYLDNGLWKRGVVFIKEIVPKPAITIVANTLYKEHYDTMPMRHNWTIDKEELTVSYDWKKKDWHSFKVIANNRPSPIPELSEAEFITEHYWGYTKLTDTKTAEYGVEHPRWHAYPILEYSIDVDFGLVYGPDFNFLNAEKPSSVFLAEGSEIEVKKGRNL